MSRSTLRRARGRALASLRLTPRFDPTLVLASLLLAPGCYEGVSSFDAPDTQGDDAGSTSSDGDSESSDDTGEPEASCDPTVLTAARAPLRSLTTTQYRHVVTDLLGASVASDQALSKLAQITNGEQGGFASTTAGFDSELVRRYLELGETLAQAYVTDALPQALVCDWSQSACMETLLDELGRRAFRRPLAPAERSDYLGIYTTIRDEYGVQSGVETLVTALLASPAFLYLDEPVRELPSAGQDVVPLDAYAVASRLSFFLWSSGPDDALLDAAESGALDDPTRLEQEVERMMDDPRFLRTVESFHAQWLGVEHLENLALGESMTQELNTFVDDLFTAGDARIETLLGADYSFVDDELAALYGVEAPAEPFGRVELDPGQRTGVLTQLGFLQHTGAIFPEVHRGIFVRESLLCDTLPPPPPGAVDANADLETTRLEDPNCNYCHRLTDAIGFGFDGYDADGRFQALTDARGEVNSTTPDGLEGSFESIPELADLLIGAPQVDRCFAIQWSRFALQRLESSEEHCVFDGFSNELTNSEGDLRKLVFGIATSEWFRSRAATDFVSP